MSCISSNSDHFSNMYFLNSSYTSFFFPSLVLVFFNQRSCLRYFNANFSPANLTAYVANVNPALTSYVLNNITTAQVANLVSRHRKTTRSEFKDSPNMIRRNK